MKSFKVFAGVLSVLAGLLVGSLVRHPVLIFG